MSKTHLLLSLPDTQSRQRVLHLLREQEPQFEVVGSAEGCQQNPLCHWLQRLPPQTLGEVRASLDEAVATLERTRHAFKSTQLATLRKHLSRLRDELSASDNCGKS